jgi:hypothetical protein
MGFQALPRFGTSLLSKARPLRVLPAGKYILQDQHNKLSMHLTKSQAVSSAILNLHVLQIPSLVAAFTVMSLWYLCLIFRGSLNPHLSFSPSAFQVLFPTLIFLLRSHMHRPAVRPSPISLSNRMVL